MNEDLPKKDWIINDDFAEFNRFKQYRKKHLHETESCMTNLMKVRCALTESGRPDAFHLGFFRSEGENIWRIGQTQVRHACETRLYVYLYVKGFTVYVLTIGDKSQQKKDIQRCKNLVKAIEERRNNGSENLQ